jgi:cytochrome P450
MLKIAPGPKRKFSLKPLFDFQKDPLSVLSRLKAHGDVARMTLARSVFLVSDPELIRQVFLPLNDGFTKGRALQRAKVILGEGLLTSEGQWHARQRRLIMPAFHRSRLALYAKAMIDLAAKQRDGWQAGQELDLRQEMMRLTLEIAGQTMFGAQLADDAQAISDALTEIMNRFKLAVVPGIEWMQHLPTPGNLKFKRAIRRLDQVVYRIIRERRENGGDHEDLLSMLLAAEDEENERKHMSDTQVRDEVMTLFLAGHETTANALTWTFVHLSKNPEVAAKLKQELDSVLGGRLPTPEDYPRLKYTEMVFMESLRLDPPAWIIGRQAIEALELGGFEIPRKSIVVMSPYLNHRDPRFWEEPERFNPERFSPEAKASRPTFAYFPFGAGPRACIGEGFAWMEGVLVLATLCQKWRLELLPGQTIEKWPQFTLRPRGKVQIKLSPATGF